MKFSTVFTSQFIAILLSFLSLQEAQAIGKVLECHEVRSGPAELSINLFAGTANDFLLVEHHTAEAAEYLVKDTLQAATPDKYKGVFRSAKVELWVSLKEGRTSSGDEGFLAKYRLLAPTPTETDIVCWYSKRAQVLPAIVTVTATKAEPKAKELAKK